MTTMYTIFQSAHSGFRWIALVLLVATVVIYFIKWRGNTDYTGKDKKLYTIMLSMLHLQVLIGIVLYFISPKVQFSAATMKTDFLRFFTVEHAFLMLAAAVVATIGSAKIKRKSANIKFKTGFWFAFATLILILVGIPWPFQDLGAGWF